MFRSSLMGAGVTCYMVGRKSLQGGFGKTATRFDTAGRFC